jgi:hypothetical protein
MHDHDHPHRPHDHGPHDHGPHGRDTGRVWASPHGHNRRGQEAAQWQTPHRPDEPHGEDRANDAHRDLDLVETAFLEAFVPARDPTSLIRLAGVPFAAVGPDGGRLVLLRVEILHTTDLGSVMPHVGGATFQYAPLPAQLASRRQRLGFVYFDGTGTRTLDLPTARGLAHIA